MARSTVADMVKDMGLEWSDWQAMSRQERMSRTLAHSRGEQYDPTKLVACPTLPNGIRMAGWDR